MPGWDTTDKYHRFRIRDPGLFVEGNFRTTDFDGKLPDGVKVIRGKLKSNNEWASQSIMFDVKKFTLAEAKKWYSEHKDSVKSSDEHSFLKAKSFDCECIKCGYEMTSEKHCADLKCPKCGGRMRRKERPGPGQKDENLKDLKIITTEPIEFKSIDDNNWIIKGYASTDDIDSYKEKILPTAFEKTLPLYMRTPVLMFFHPFNIPTDSDGKLPVGKILEAEIKTRGLWIKAQISKTAPKIWKLIQEGMLKAFSIGFNLWAGEEEDIEMDGDVRIIKNLRLIEISIVPVGANPEALFEMAKAKGINLKSFFGEGKKDEAKFVLDEDLENKQELNQKQKEKEMELDVKLKEDLENGLKFIHQIKEKVQEIPTKAELEQFQENVKGDLLKVMEEQTKRRRKIEFEAELDADPYVDASPLNHPAIWLARTPQQKFANLITTTTRNQKVKEMQVAADDLLLTHILMKKFSSGYGGIKSLRMFERYSQVSSDFRKALDTATAGEGLEWIPTGFSAELIDKVRLELKVAGLFQQFTMPTNPFKYPLLTGDVTIYFMPESLADLSEKIPASSITTAGLTFTAVKLAARILCSDEITEDSVVAILPVLKNDLAKGLAEGLEDVIINGDTTATHQDSDVTAAKDRRKAFKGLRKLAAAGAKYDTGANFTASDIRQVRGQMGKYAVNPADCAIVTSISAYLKSFLNFTEVATVDKFGEQATWLKGYLTALDGMPIIISEKVRQDLNATGVYDGVTTTKSIFAIVNKGCYLIGNRRLVTVKQASDIETDQEILVITQRLDFEPKYPAASEYAVGIGYNIVPGT